MRYFRETLANLLYSRFGVVQDIRSVRNLSFYLQIALLSLSTISNTIFFLLPLKGFLLFISGKKIIFDDPRNILIATLGLMIGVLLFRIWSTNYLSRLSGQESFGSPEISILKSRRLPPKKKYFTMLTEFTRSLLSNLLIVVLLNIGIACLDILNFDIVLIAESIYLFVMLFRYHSYLEKGLNPNRIKPFSRHLDMAVFLLVVIMMTPRIFTFSIEPHIFIITVLLFRSSMNAFRNSLISMLAPEAFDIFSFRAELRSDKQQTKFDKLMKFVEEGGEVSPRKICVDHADIFDHPKNIKKLVIALKHYRDRKRPMSVGRNLKTLSVAFWGDMGIGNFLQHLPLFSYLKHHSRNIEITVFFSSRSRPESELALKSKDINRVIFVEANGDSINRRIIEIAKQQRLSTDVLIFKFNKTAVIPVLMAMLEPKLIVGHTNGGGFHGKYDELYDCRIPFSSDTSEEVNALKLGFELLVHVGAPNVEPVPDNLPALGSRLWPRSPVKSILRIVKSKFIQKYVVISPCVSSAQSWKRWPLTNWPAVTEFLIDAGYRVLLIGSMKERSEIDEILIRIPEDKRDHCRNLAGQLSIEETFYISRDSHLSLSNDSSLMHIAKHAGNAHISLIGPSDKIRSLPNMNNIKFVGFPCVCNDKSTLAVETLERIMNCGGECMKSIKIEELRKAIIRTLRA